MLQLLRGLRIFGLVMRKLVQLLSLFLFTVGVGEGAAGGNPLFLQTFEAAWSQVGETYYDKDFGGLDWDAVGERYRSQVGRAADMEEVRALVRSMLFELGESHLALLSPGGEELVDVLPWSGGWAGVDLAYQGEKVVFYRVEEGGAAFAAGIRAGDVLLSVDGSGMRAFKRSARRSGQPAHLHRFSVLAALQSRFRGSVGDELSLWVKSPGVRKRETTLKLGRYEGLTSEPFGQVGRLPLELEMELLDGGVGLLRFSIWFPEIMPQIREFIVGLPSDGGGLVIDLRGNPGGMMFMAGGLAGMLVDEQSELGRTTLRSGHMNVVGFPQRGRFLGKVAVLVDEASASTSELFAIGMQELGRVRVFGQPTAGAALPSVITSLPNGDSLQVAMGDFKTPKGVSLEGRGVTPDEVVAISPIDLSEGRDSVLHAALNWIKETQ